MHELTCVVHVHSTFSDGTATVPEIADVARATGADAVLLTDHDTLEAKRHGLDGWHGDVLLLVGLEVSPRGGHLLAFDVDSEVGHGGVDEAQIMDAVRDAGGLAFAAHPFSRGSRMSRRIGRPHPWRTLDHDALTGIELWSLVTDSAEAWASPREAVDFMRRPERALDGPPGRHLAAWDALCARRQVVGIGGLDAHQSGLRLRGGRVLSPFAHERFFSWLRTHVLCDRPSSGALAPDRAAVYRALAEGHCFLGIDGIAPTNGFRFWADRDGARIEMGGEASAGGWTLRVGLPLDADARLLRDGVEVAAADGSELAWPAREPGVYRVEASLAGRTWIVSNPIYLRSRDAGPTG